MTLFGAVRFMARLKTLFLLLLIFHLSSLISHPACAGGLIRDAEVESTLRDYTDPIFETAGLKPSAINIYLVDDDSINAFVAGGANLFIHTGLILQADSPAMLLGVIAHESGHIAGGHLAKGAEKLKDAQLGTILSTVLGAAAAAASGKPEAAAAVITGTGGAIARNFLSFSRANENAADQAGLGYLDRLGISASGMLDVFTILKRQERLHLGKPNPYLMTHPLTSDRITTVQNHVDQSPIAKGAYPKKLDEKHARMVAKLYGFIKPPLQTLRTYAANDKSIAARMARAIAFFKQAKTDEAMALMDGLTAQYPSDGFLYDLKGQILFESARVEEAYTAYSKAASLKPNEPLILIELAKTELARNVPGDVDSAIKNLNKSIVMERDNSSAWYLLASAYGRQGNQPMASLALAEQALLTGDAEEAIIQSTRALGSLPAASPSWRRADDLKRSALQMRKEQKDAESVF